MKKKKNEIRWEKKLYTWNRIKSRVKISKKKKKRKRNKKRKKI